MVSEARIQEVVSFALDNNDNEACEVYGVTHETLGRYKRKYDEFNEDLEQRALMAKLQEMYSPQELRALAKGDGISPDTIPEPHLDFGGKRVRFGFVTDTHIGSKYLKEKVFLHTLKTIHDSGAEFLVHTGDVTEGLSSKIPGHVFELKHISFDAQKEAAIDLLGVWDRPLYVISGNHDRRFSDAVGAHIVKDICAQLPKATFVGDEQGRIFINDTPIMLWHGRDGNSYAISYRLQKIVETFSGGTKPAVLLAGHTHKMGYFFDRNIHVISGGAIQLQTPFMRGKRLAVHAGFWIVDMWTKCRRVTKISPTFYPFYA